jgi:hypothetical protein
MTGALSFAASLAQASVSVQKLAPSLGPLASHDPLRLNLPAYGSPGDAGAPSPSSLEVFAALYLQAEMSRRA